MDGLEFPPEVLEENSVDLEVMGGASIVEDIEGDVHLVSLHDFGGVVILVEMIILVPEERSDFVFSVEPGPEDEQSAISRHEDFSFLSEQFGQMRTDPVESPPEVQGEGVPHAEPFDEDVLAGISGADFHPSEEFSDFSVSLGEFIVD